MDNKKNYEAVVLAVAHDEFKTIDFEKFYNSEAVIFDTKAVVDRKWVGGWKIIIRYKIESFFI